MKNIYFTIPEAESPDDSHVIYRLISEGCTCVRSIGTFPDIRRKNAVFKRK